MKARLISSLLLSACVVAVGQGTLNFCNINPAGVNAPVYAADGKTKLAGAYFVAELLAGPTPNALSSVATAPILAGPAAGYFQGGVVVVANVAPGAVAYVQVRVWSGPGCFDCTYPTIWAQTSVFAILTGGSCCPPTLPAPLVGLTPIVLGVDPNPRLKLSAFSTNTILATWGQFYPSYIVQQSPSLSPPDWTTLTNTRFVVGEQYGVILPKPETTMFYRLISRY